jgi:hypothetical protein
MRRIDSPWLPGDADSDFALGFGHPAGHSPLSEQSPAANLHSDGAEACSPHWETAWIDLGGEG